MAVQRGIGSIVFSILGILILVGAVVLIASILGSEAPIKPLMYKTIELRKAVAPVERANLISDIDDLVAQAESEEVSDQWGRMMQCLADGCPDEAYLDMVLVTVASFEEDIPESAVLINIIATAKYWGDPEHLLEFSKALSIANEQIDALDDRKVAKAWESVVDCNGVCAEKYDLYFDLIGMIVQ